MVDIDEFYIFSAISTPFDASYPYLTSWIVAATLIYVYIMCCKARLLNMMSSSEQRCNVFGCHLEVVPTVCKRKRSTYTLFRRSVYIFPNTVEWLSCT